MDDKKVHKELKSAAESLREASDQLRGKRESHTFRNLVLLTIVGAVLAIALSEDLRKAVLDRLFGAEEEFEYTSTTTASSADESARPAPDRYPLRRGNVFVNASRPRGPPFIRSRRCSRARGDSPRPWRC